MSVLEQNDWKSVYRLGAITTVIVLVGIVLDLVIANITGGDLSTLPQTAIERFIEFQSNPWLGLYHLDLLNITNQIIMIPSYLALYTAHLKSDKALSTLAFIIFLVGTTIFITTNTALPTLELSHKYFSTSSEIQKAALAGAGESLLVRGAHGSPGVFIGFLLPNIAGLIMSWVMLRGKIFSKATSILGIIGSLGIIIYLILVTFIPTAKNMALVFATPGGLLLMTWMIMFTKRLFELAK